MRTPSEITEGVISWLYEHSGGVIALVVSLLHDAQEIAILDGRDALDLSILNEAYQRMRQIHGYIKPTVIHGSIPKRKRPAIPDGQDIPEALPDIAALVEQAKASGADVVGVLRAYFSVEEVAV